VSWRFIPGENVSDVPGGYVWNAKPVDCDNQIVCAYKPDGPGKMEATTWVEGREVVVRSSGIPSPELTLVCGTQEGKKVRLTLVRGESFNCTLRASGGRATILDWVFVGAGQTIRSNAPYTGWSGPMVVSGVVTARAVFGVDTVVATAEVEVTSRPWVDRIAAPTVKYYGCPDPLTAECPLPDTLVHWHDLGRLDPGPSTWPTRTEHINSGPNAGFRYIPGDDSFLNIRDPWIQLNAVLRNPGHEFWRSRPDCDVAKVHANVLEHETIHYDGIKALVEAGVTPGWLESYTPFGTVTETYAAMNERLADYQTALNNAGDKDHTNPRFTNPPCDMRLPSTRRNPRVPGRQRT
jgi:hypothetical protein